jgi:hypothetical protein
MKTRTVLAAFFGSLFVTGCASTPRPVVPLTIEVLTAVSKSSPAQLGFGAAATVHVGTAGALGLRAMGGYEYSMWDGGHDDVLSLGLQVRQPVLGESGTLSFGGEAVYHRWICKSEALLGCGDSPAANGLGLNGLAFLPIANGRANLWASAGPKWLTDFSSDGVVSFESGFGWHAKFGVELPIGH